MSIIRITEGENITNIEGSWTVFTDEFEAAAGQFSHFTAVQGTNFGNPKNDESKESKYFKEGWWSSDVQGNNRITEAHIGDIVYFNISTQNIPDIDDNTGNPSEISIQLFDDDGGWGNPADPINVREVSKDPITGLDVLGDLVTSKIVSGSKVSYSLTLSEGLIGFIEDDYGDEIELYLECGYKEEQNIKLPAFEFNYLKVFEKEVLITVIVELPMKNYDYSGMGIGEQVVAKAGLLGHTAIGIDKEYYDYGPEQDSSILKGTISESKYGDLNNDGDTIDSYNGIDDPDLKDSGLNQGEYGNPMGTLGSPWWDKAFTSNGNANLADIMTILKNDNLRKQYGILGEVHIFEIEVRESQAKTVKQWWENKYNKNLGMYSVNIMENGEHCTSTVHDSLVEAKIIKNMAYGSICTPKYFLNHLKYIMVSNTAGSKKGEKAKETILKDLS